MRLWRRWYLAGAWCCLATVKQVLGNPSSSPVCQTGKHELALSGGSHNDYDYTKSTEEFYASPSSQHTGPFTNIRRTMDYSHHRVYSPARQRVQDDIILRELREGDPDSASHVDGRGVRQWIIFTAGAMGVGKSYTLQWAAPWLPEAFVLADADRLRHHLPEMNGYKERNPNTAGLLTQKEAGYMSELLAAAGLLQGRNVVIDGSMRDAAWHTRYIRHLRSQFPGVRVAILHVQAEKDVIFQRAQSRGQSGRSVPVDILRDSVEQVPSSVQLLREEVDLIIHVNNSVDGSDPRITAWDCEKMELPPALSDQIEELDGIMEWELLAKIFRA